MIKSMTSFGRASLEIDKREYLVEIKTVNHRYNDINIKINKQLSYLEDAIRKLVLNYICRGKIEVYIEVNDYNEEGKEVRLNHQLISAYVKELNEVCKENNIINDISVMQVLQLPDTLKVKNTSEALEQEVMQCVTQALENLMEMRLFEGNRILQDIEKRLKRVEERVNNIEEKAVGLVDKYREKLEGRILELCNGKIDEARLAQEAVIYADKTSIQEELIRLKSHCNQFRLVLVSNDSAGKKLDFIVQEMNREINTIGAKANCLEITNEVIEIKSELEDIREQIQNIE